MDPAGLILFIIGATFIGGGLIQAFIRELREERKRNRR